MLSWCHVPRAPRTGTPQPQLGRGWGLPLPFSLYPLFPPVFLPSPAFPTKPPQLKPSPITPPVSSHDPPRTLSAFPSDAPKRGSGSSSPGSVELAAARRRLVAAEGRRRAAAELEGRVLQVHCALRHAELRLAARAEALGRLGAGVAQAQLALAAHTQRLQKGLRRRPRPRPAALLAAARALRSCVPWAPARSRGPAAPPAASRRSGGPRGVGAPSRVWGI
uniref:TMF1 regulated nuclear protein 1 n=1 Tax=Strigops habroptila TaxID=2489341 RepID=A0A672UWF2_STRHB